MEGGTQFWAGLPTGRDEVLRGYWTRLRLGVTSRPSDVVGCSCGIDRRGEGSKLRPLRTAQGTTAIAQP